MASKHRFSKKAKTDLRSIWEYTLRTWGQSQADNYTEKIEARLEDLAESPGKGRLRKEIQTYAPLGSVNISFSIGH